MRGLEAVRTDWTPLARDFQRTIEHGNVGEAVTATVVVTKEQVVVTASDEWSRN